MPQKNTRSLLGIFHFSFSMDTKVFKNKSKAIITSLFSFFLFSLSYGQFPVDKNFEGLKAAPRSMDETTEMVSEGIKFRQVYHFDILGHLLKIENYNNFNIDEDSLYLGEITFFEYTAANSRSSYTLSPVNGDTLKVSHYVFFGEKYIKVSTENFNDSYSTEIIQTLDQKGRIVVTYAVISDENSEEIYSASVTDFIYDGDKLQKLIVVNDRIGTEGKEVICMNKRYDEQGNLTHLEFADEKGEIVSVVDKMYQYYNTD
jgi:hypothetical protein